MVKKKSKTLGSLEPVTFTWLFIEIILTYILIKFDLICIFCKQTTNFIKKNKKQTNKQTNKNRKIYKTTNYHIPTIKTWVNPNKHSVEVMALLRKFLFFYFFFRYHRFYLVNILLHFYFRVQVPLKYTCEILLWISREIFKTIITYKAILYNSNIFYCIQYYHSLFNIFWNNELIPSNLFSFIFLWNSFLNNR